MLFRSKKTVDASNRDSSDLEKTEATSEAKSIQTEIKLIDITTATKIVKNVNDNLNYLAVPKDKFINFDIEKEAELQAMV